jgi:hypothetical protein
MAPYTRDMARKATISSTTNTNQVEASSSTTTAREEWYFGDTSGERLGLVVTGHMLKLMGVDDASQMWEDVTSTLGLDLSHKKEVM